MVAQTALVGRKTDRDPAPAKSEFPNSYLCASILSFLMESGVCSVVIHKVLVCCSPWRTNPPLPRQLPPGKRGRTSGSVEVAPVLYLSRLGETASIAKSLSHQH